MTRLRTFIMMASDAVTDALRHGLPSDPPPDLIQRGHAKLSR
jgi:hypothetical protein